jgi:hypothetical protein
MKAVAIFLLFIGMFLVTQGYYTQQDSCPPPEVKVKYIPRSIYQDQLSPDSESIVSKQFQSLFDTIQPWPGVQDPLKVATNTNTKPTKIRQ